MFLQLAEGLNLTILHCPQRLEQRHLNLGQAGHAGDVHPLLGPVGLEGFETFTGLDIPE